MTKFTYVSLFSGIGGFEQALNKLGGKCVLASEIDKFANQAYEALYGEPTVGDITKIKAEDVPDHDLLVGGFPCQAFSIAGKRGGFDDARGTLFFEMARIAAEKKPKVILAENVKGLVSHDKGKTLDTIVKTLNDIGYRVDFEVLNSKYFGVAQNRERIFIVAIREDLIENEPWAISGTTIVPKGKRRIAEYEDIKTFNFDWPAQENVNTRLVDVLESTVDERYYLSDEKTAQLVAKLDEKQRSDAPNIVHNIYGGFNESKPRVFKEESPTIRTSAGGGHLPSVLEERPVQHSLDAGLLDGRTKIREDGTTTTLSATYHKGLCGQGRPHVLESEKIAKGCSTRTRAYAGQPEALEVRQDDVSNTVTSVKKDSMALLSEPTVQSVGNTNPSGSGMGGQVYDVDAGLAPTVTTNKGEGSRITQAPKYRIRKLTPLECFRLQGFSDDTHQTLVDEGISNTQLYKFAGNAVTVNVIEALGSRLLTYL